MLKKIAKALILVFAALGLFFTGYGSVIWYKYLRVEPRLSHQSLNCTGECDFAMLKGTNKRSTHKHQ